MSTSRWYASSALFALSACTYQPAPVPMSGPASDIAALEGTWEGQYASDQSGRAGSIVFTVRAGTDTAFGDVLMAPNAGPWMRAADYDRPEHARHVSSPELLRIAFVRVAGGTVRGALEPYLAPDCGCTVWTEFDGTRIGNRIEGVYVTQGQNSLRQQGTWSVQRRKSVAQAP